MMIPRFLVIDTETTGFTNASRVLELGMVFCEDGQVVDSYGQRFNPSGVDWESSSVLGALDVNGIRREDLVGCPDFGDVVDHIAMIFRRYAIWVGHNLSFDMRMLSNEFMRVNKQIPNVMTATKVCTLDHDRAANKRAPSHKLEAVAERYGVKLADAHTAVGDATATAEIFLRMCEEQSFSAVFMQRLAKVAAEEQRLINPGPIVVVDGPAKVPSWS